jgi:hypothetical protein
VSCFTLEKLLYSRGAAVLEELLSYREAGVLYRKHLFPEKLPRFHYNFPFFLDGEKPGAE